MVRKAKNVDQLWESPRLTTEHCATMQELVAAVKSHCSEKAKANVLASLWRLFMEADKAGIAQSRSAAEQELWAHLLGSPDKWVVDNTWPLQRVSSWDFYYLNISHHCISLALLGSTVKPIKLPTRSTRSWSGLTGKVIWGSSFPSSLAIRECAHFWASQITAFSEMSDAAQRNCNCENHTMAWEGEKLKQHLKS